MKKVLSFIVALIFVTLIPIQTLAIDSVNHQLDVFLMNDVSDLKNCVLEEQSGLSEIKSIDTVTVNKLKTLNATNEEKSEALFENIDISYSTDNKSQIDVAENFDEIKSVSSSSSYIKISEDGTETIMSEEDCLNEIAQTNNLTRSSTIGDSLENTDEDGYMHLVIAYIYNGNGNFTVIGEFEWLNGPVNRWTDAFSLYSPMMNPENPNTNSFAKYTQYTNTSGEVVSEWSDEDPTIESGGVFYEWNTPGIHIAPLSDSNFACQIWATFIVQDYDDYTQSLCVYSKYAHKKLSLSSSFSISPEKKGIVLGANLESNLQVAYYLHSFTWDFADVARQAGEY